MNVQVWEHSALNHQIFGCGEVNSH